MKNFTFLFAFLFLSCSVDEDLFDDCNCFFYPDTTQVFDLETGEELEFFKGDENELFNKCEYGVDTLAVGRKIGSRMFVTAYSTICLE